MRRIAYDLDIGYCGCNEEGEIEVADDMTDSQISDMVHEMAIEHAQSWEGDSRLGWHEDMLEEESAEQTESFYEGVCGSWRFMEEGEEL